MHSGSGDRWELGRPGSADARGLATTIDVRSDRPRVVVVMPAYNEEALEEFVVEIEAALDPVAATLQFVVVDDASPVTPVAVESLPLGSQVEVLRNEANRGHGPSVMRAYAAGLVTEPDVVIHVDGDGHFSGADFVALLDALGDHDAVLGVRTGRTEPWFRRVLTAGARIVSGQGGSGGDPNTPLRLYRAAALEQLLRSVSADSVVPHLHFTRLHDRLGLDVREIPVTHRPRRGASPVGTSWQGSRTLALFPCARLLRLAVRASWELVRADYGRWILGALLVAATLAVVAPGFGMALGFDEAYNLQIVANLLHGHGYATNGALAAGHPQLFDYRVTTGPTLMLPVAAVTALLGEHVWVYRVVPTIAFVALLVAWWVVGRRLAGPRLSRVGGAAAVLGVLSLNTAGIWYDGRIGAGTVVGETTSTLFVLLAVMLARRPGWAGLLFGLAVMTKVLVLLALPGVMLAVVIAAGRRWAPRAVLAAAAAAMAPVVAWQVVRVATLGWSGAMAANGDFLTFLRGTGSGRPDPLLQLLSQINMLGAGAAAIFVAVVAVVAVLARLAGHWPPRLQREDLALAGGVFAACTALEGYWLLLEGQNVLRHSVQALQLLTPLLLVGAVRGLGALRPRLLRDVTAVVLTAAVVAGLVMATRSAWSPPGPSLSQQRTVARLVAGHGSTYWFLRTWTAPELTLLDPSLEARPLEGASGGLLVLGGMSGRLRPDACDQILDVYADYTVCRVAPGHPVRPVVAFVNGVPVP